MSYIKLNGRTFDADVAISAYERNFNVVDGQNAGRTMSGLMTRDIIGTYIGHTPHRIPARGQLCRSGCVLELPHRAFGG